MIHQSFLYGLQIWNEILEAGLVWTVDGTQVLMGNGASAGVPDQLMKLCSRPLGEIELITGKTARHIMINRLPPGVIVPIHVDPVLDDPERWHLPLVTNNHCCFWDEVRGFQFFKLDYWYRVDYKIRHTIMNLGTTERVHLIVDLV